MCKVYEFPVQMKLPEEVEQALQKLAEDYVKGINDLLEESSKYYSTEEEENAFMELLYSTYETVLLKTIEES